MLQTAKLKAAAEREMKAVHEAINQQTSMRQGESQSADSATAPLRARLNRAIEVMQEGLIERDTEVRSSTISSRQSTIACLVTMSQKHLVAIYQFLTGSPLVLDNGCCQSG